jgi:hypothetical protein
MSKKKKLKQDLIDLAYTIQAMDEEARNYAVMSVQAIAARETRGDDLTTPNYKNLSIERQDTITSCYQAFEELKALGDLLLFATENENPAFYDETLPNIGQLIISRTKISMNEICPKTVNS